MSELATVQQPTIPSPTQPFDATSTDSVKQTKKDTDVPKDHFLNILIVVLIVIIIYYAIKKYKQQRCGYNKSNESIRDDPSADFNVHEIIKSIKQKQAAILGRTV
jgi:hypothetical protein